MLRVTWALARHSILSCANKCKPLSIFQKVCNQYGLRSKFTIQNKTLQKTSSIISLLESTFSILGINSTVFPRYMMLIDTKMLFACMM